MNDPVDKLYGEFLLNNKYHSTTEVLDGPKETQALLAIVNNLPLVLQITIQCSNVVNCGQASVRVDGMFGQFCHSESYLYFGVCSYSDYGSSPFFKPSFAVAISYNPDMHYGVMYFLESPLAATPVGSEGY